MDLGRLHYHLECGGNFEKTCFVTLPHRYTLKARDFINYKETEVAHAFDLRLDESSYAALLRNIPNAKVDIYMPTTILRHLSDSELTL